jgi:phage recombination protein Bet
MNDEAPTPDEAREPDHDDEVLQESAREHVRPARPARPVSVGPTTLPQNSDVQQWTEAQGAMARAAGLVFVYPDWHDQAGEEVFAPRPVVERFLAVCQRTGLDPLARQVYCIGRASKGGVEWSIQTGIDGFRVVAERTGQYRGRAPFEWLTSKRQWVDVFIPGMDGPHPLAARATVYREGWPHPTVAVAEWGAYAQTKSRGGLTAMWEKQGAGQLAKCAEALALRTAFPQDLSGVYTDDEQAGPAQAIEQDRRAELEAAAVDWTATVEAATTEEELVDLRARLIANNAPPEAHAAALARLATIRNAAKQDEPEQPKAAAAPEQSTTEPEPSADDPAWTGEPCPACNGMHDPSIHDVEELTDEDKADEAKLAEPLAVMAPPRQPAKARPAFNPAAMQKGTRS